MAFELKNKELRRIIGELKNASKMHGKQAEDLQAYADNIKKSPMTKKGPCWEGYEMIGMKDKGGRQVPNCVPKK